MTGDNLEQILNSPSDRPISGVKNKREATKAITLRIPEWWIKKLEKLGHRLSLDFKYTVNKQDLILEAIRRQFIDDPTHSILKREGVLTDSEKLKLCKAVILASKQPTL